MRGGFNLAISLRVFIPGRRVENMLLMEALRKAIMYFGKAGSVELFYLIIWPDLQDTAAKTGVVIGQVPLPHAWSCGTSQRKTG